MSFWIDGLKLAFQAAHSFFPAFYVAAFVAASAAGAPLLSCVAPVERGVSALRQRAAAAPSVHFCDYTARLSRTAPLLFSRACRRNASLVHLPPVPKRTAIARA